MALFGCDATLDYTVIGTVVIYSVAQKKDSSMKKLKTALPKLIVIAVLVCAALILHHYHVGDYLSFSSLEKHIATLRYFVNIHYFSTVLFYITAFTFATALSVPGGTILFITAGGLMFGVVPGILYANIGVTVGSILLLLLSRYLLGSWLQQRFAARLQTFNNEIAIHGYYYLLLVRFASLLPTCLVTILSGMTLVPLSTFMWTTSLGVIPISLFYTLAGDTLGQFRSYGDLCSLNGVLCIGLFVLPRVLVIPLVIRFVRQRRDKKQASSKNPNFP